MKKKIITMFMVFAFIMMTFVQPVFADYEPELPSLYKTFSDDFMFGTFSGMSNYFPNWQGSTTSDLIQHHYNSWSPANEFKPDSQFGNGSVSRAAYDTVVRENYATEEEYLAAKDKANRTVTLAPMTTSGWFGPGMQEFLENVRVENAKRGPNDQIKIKAHVLVWHNMTNPSFFRNGFAASGEDWASRDVMLDRLDSYIKLVLTRYAPYNDIIYSWDVANEVIDDYTGYVRNENDYQPSNWGRIFKAPAGMTGDEKLLYESEYVRKAFESARKYSRELGVNWTLGYNDFFDSDKPYEPKRTATVKMLKPIYEAGNIDFVGMQGRMATAGPSMELFKETFNMYSTVCSQIQFTESDTRCDLEANPDYDPNDIHAQYYLDNGEKNPNWDRNDIHSKVLRVIPGWQPSWANLPEYQMKQADYLADLFDFLLQNSRGNGGKIVLYAVDGLNDTNTFNSSKGCHIFTGSYNSNWWDTSGSNTAKMSYYSIIGSKARFELQKKLNAAPDAAKEKLYTPYTWAAYTAAKTAAEDILKVRIYNINDVNNVNAAAGALDKAVNELMFNIDPMAAPAVAAKILKYNNIKEVYKDNSNSGNFVNDISAYMGPQAKFSDLPETIMSGDMEVSNPAYRQAVLDFLKAQPMMAGKDLVMPTGEFFIGQGE